MGKSPAHFAGLGRSADKMAEDPHDFAPIYKCTCDGVCEAHQAPEGIIPVHSFYTPCHQAFGADGFFFNF